MVLSLLMKLSGIKIITPTLFFLFLLFGQSITAEDLVIPKRTGIIELIGPDIFLDIDSSDGVRLGQEFVVYDPSDPQEQIKALIIIREKNQGYSVARQRYSHSPISLNDQIHTVSRYPLSLEVQGSVIVSEIGNQENQGSFLFAVQGIWNSGFYNFRPLGGVSLGLLNISQVENPVRSFIVTPYIGGEFNVYLDRFRVHMQTSLGLTGVLPGNTNMVLGFYDGSILARFAYLISDRVELIPSLGFVYKLGVAGRFGNTGGITTGFGVSFR